MVHGHHCHHPQEDSITQGLTSLGLGSQCTLHVTISV